jgi:hypothetical protein
MLLRRLLGQNQNRQQRDPCQYFNRLLGVFARFIAIRAFALSLTIMLIGCTTPKEPVAWKPELSRPIILDFSYGGAFSSQTRYIADGVRACREIGEPCRRPDGVTDYSVKRQVEVTPPAARWTRFWRTVNSLDVAHWKPEYSPQDVGKTVFDGTQWSLEFSTLSGTSQSTGDNAYPTIGRPKTTTLDDAAFRKLQEAFEALFDCQNA